MEIQEGKISDLVQDDQNANLGTPEGSELLDHSIKKLGLGRSVLADKNLRVIAGNKTTERAAENGYDDIIIVKTDGSKLVVVQRTDIDLDTPEGRALATADNKIAEKNLKWDQDVLAAYEEHFDVDLTEWGFHDPDQVSTINEQDEWDQMDMPSFEAGKDSIKLQINFENEADRDRFLLEVGLTVSKKGAKLWSTWWPEKTTGFQSTQLKYEEQAAVSDLRNQQGEV